MYITDIIVEGFHDIATMQPDTPLTVFHGTDIDHAMEFCVNGIDARQRHHRLYPHWDQGEYVNRGLFVTTTLKVAIGFGQVVLKFKVLAKNLHNQYPSPKSQRQANDVFRQDYPKSFRPGASWNLLGAGNEKQALFRGLVSPRAIEKVFLVRYDKEGNYSNGRYDEYKAAISPAEFLQLFTSKGTKAPHKLMIEPQQLNLTPDDLLTMLVKKYGRMSKRGEDTAWIENIIREAIDPARHKTYQSQIQGLMSFSGGTAIPYSVAKRLLPQFLTRFGMKPAPNVQERMKKGPHFG